MKLAVLFPGIGYHCDKPLLYYSKDTCHALKYDEVISLNYSYSGAGIRGNKEKMKEVFECLYMQAKERLSSVDFAKYDQITFLSKSVGTVIASVYANEIKVNCRQVLYTPLEATFQLASHDRSIAFLGTDDSWSDVSEVIQLAKEQSIPIYTYEGANHSLETEDTLNNIGILSDVMQKVVDFLKE